MQVKHKSYSMNVFERHAVQCIHRMSQNPSKCFKSNLLPKSLTRLLHKHNDYVSAHLAMVMLVV